MKPLYLTLISCALSFLFCLNALSQNTITITGKVLDGSTNEPLAGASVVIKDAKTGTSTNADGTFSISVPSDTKYLEVSFVSMQKQTITLETGKVNYEVKMLSDGSSTDEVVVGFKRVDVYSRRRQESLIKVPETVSAFSAQQIEEAGINKVGDFVGLTPNVTFINSQNVGNIALTVRGISQVRNGDAPVAYVIDGVTMPSPNSINQELFDVELIEVMKGPQGALYGRNAIGGAINITTKKPTDNFEHYAKLHYGNGNNFKAQATSSGAILRSKLLYRAGGFYSNREGLIKNTTLNKFVDFAEQYGGRGQLFAFFSPKVKADASVSFSKANTGAIYWINPPADSMSNDFSGSPVSDIMGNSNRTLIDAHLKLNVDLGKVGDLEWVNAYSFVDEVFSGDLDFTSASLLGQRQALVNRGLIEEIRLTSKSKQRVRWVLGAFMMLNQRDLTTTGTVDLASPLAPLFGFEPGTGFAPFLQRDERNDNTTLAGFGQINYDITQKLEFTASLRYDNDLRRQTNLADNSSREKSFNELQPKIALAFRPSNNMTLYAQYAKGFRSGGFNAPGIDAFPAIYDKEVTDNLELGFKSSLFQDRIVLNASAFRINFANQQVFIVDLATVAQGILNIDNTVAYGTELELNIKPTPRLVITNALGFTDSKISKLSSNTQWEGNYSPLTARSTFATAIQYNVDLGNNYSLMPRISYEHRGKMYWHVDNKDYQQPFGLLNARLMLNHKKWSLTAYGTNLLNTEYNIELVAKEFSGGSADVRWPSQPLQWGLELRYNF